MKLMFKKGDRVRCINTGNSSALKLGAVYTVKRVSKIYNNTNYTVYPEGPGMEPSFNYPQDRFELAKMSNEDRIQRRMEELNV